MTDISLSATPSDERLSRSSRALLLLNTGRSTSTSTLHSDGFLSESECSTKSNKSLFSGRIRRRKNRKNIEKKIGNEGHSTEHLFVAGRKEEFPEQSLTKIKRKFTFSSRKLMGRSRSDEVADEHAIIGINPLVRVDPVDLTFDTSLVNCDEVHQTRYKSNSTKSISCSRNRLKMLFRSKRSPTNETVSISPASSGSLSTNECGGFDFDTTTSHRDRVEENKSIDEDDVSVLSTCSYLTAPSAGEDEEEWRKDNSKGLGLKSGRAKEHPSPLLPFTHDLDLSVSSEEVRFDWEIDSHNDLMLSSRLQHDELEKICDEEIYSQLCSESIGKEKMQPKVVKGSKSGSFDVSSKKESTHLSGILKKDATNCTSLTSGSKTTDKINNLLNCAQPPDYPRFMLASELPESNDDPVSSMRAPSVEVSINGKNGEDNELYKLKLSLDDANRIISKMEENEKLLLADNETLAQGQVECSMEMEEASMLCDSLKEKIQIMKEQKRKLEINLKQQSDLSITEKTSWSEEREVLCDSISALEGTNGDLRQQLRDKHAESRNSRQLVKNVNEIYLSRSGHFQKPCYLDELKNVFAAKLEMRYNNLLRDNESIRSEIQNSTVLESRENLIVQLLVMNYDLKVKLAEAEITIKKQEKIGHLRQVQDKRQGECFCWIRSIFSSLLGLCIVRFLNLFVPCHEISKFSTKLDCREMNYDVKEKLAEAEITIKKQHNIVDLHHFHDNRQKKK